MSAKLHVVMYHYVRDLPNTPFPQLKGMLRDDFRAQVSTLQQRYEMATLTSALAFLRQEYRPSRDLCLLTFDDGLREHYDTVAPLLAERGIQGVFFPITSCLDGRTVAPVHMNHFLMAKLGVPRYREVFTERLGAAQPIDMGRLDVAAASKMYRWDDPKTAQFKYLFNFRLEPRVRDETVRSLFSEYLGDEHAFADELYFDWEQAREMQAAGMAMGGHSHTHRPLSSLAGEDLERDLNTCRVLLQAALREQEIWPFSYPYGKAESFSAESVLKLGQLGFDCAFSTLKGPNSACAQRFAIRRMDCKDVVA